MGAPDRDLKSVDHNVWKSIRIAFVNAHIVPFSGCLRVEVTNGIQVTCAEIPLHAPSHEVKLRQMWLWLIIYCIVNGVL